MIIKKARKNNSVYKKLLMSFSISISILIMILSFVLYFYNSKSAMDNLSSSNTTFLSQTSYSSTYMDNIANNFCKSVYLNNYTTAFINSNTEDLISIGNTLRNLENLTLPNLYIHSLYIYNRKLDTFISTETGTFYSSDYFYDQEIVKMVKNKPQNIKSDFGPFPRMAAIPGAYHEKPTKFTNVYTYLMYDTSGGAIILNINTDWLRNTILTLYDNLSHKGSELFVINENGVVMSHSKIGMFMKTISNEKYIKHILSSKVPSGSFIERMDGKKYVISYVSSNTLKWKFISMTPYKSAFSSIDKMKLVTICFSILVLLLGLFFSFIASKKLYYPIGTLTNNVRQSLRIFGTSEKNTDELSFLSSAFTKIFDKATKLESFNNNNIENLKNIYLKDLLMGNVSVLESDISNTVEDLNIDLNFKKSIFMFILKIDHYKNFVVKYDDKDRTLYKYAISNIAIEIVSEHYINEIVDIGTDHFSVLININDDEKSIETIHSTVKTMVSKIQEYVDKYLHISLSSALGYLVNETENIPFLYNNTLDISMYRLKYGHKSIITPSVLEAIHVDDFVFPLSKGKIVLDSLNLCDIERAKEAYYGIISTISSYSYDNIMASIIYLIFSIYNASSNIIEKSSTNLSHTFSEFFSEVGNYETIDEINQTFINIFEEIVKSVDSTKHTKSSTMIKNIITIINENYQDKNLCLNSISDTLLMSSVYVGRLFKNSTGKSVSEYILDIRMEKVKYYMNKTNMSVNEIVEKVGLEKNNYFYTTFKKYFGISLTNYKLETAKKKS
ncbi:AraC family transcriptional regulator [Clostridium estertheticum]|uniref:AraC family transcriptional regulator n=1 Tax=Clostridium estertheticum TaxID=238834 RepID=UPI0013E97E6B|nr:AraC family transcriptional regulator [Clostridium estertheticum]MBZ9685963.1 AraC family transcriptional regulator [Clostridium estertheticum]